MSEAGTGDGTTRWRDLLEGGNLPRFLVLCFGVWMHAADTLLVATVMPSAVRDIGGAFASMGWWRGGFWAFAAFLPTAALGLLVAWRLAGPPRAAPG